MIRSFRWLCLFALLLATTPTFARESEKPLYRPGTVPADLIDKEGTEWAGVYMFGKKVGYGSLVRKVVVFEGAKAIEGSMQVQFRAKGPGGELSMSFEGVQTFAYAAPHTMLEYRTSQVMNESQSEKRLVRRNADGSYTAKIEQAGQTRTLTAESIDYTLADLTASDVWLRSQPAVGASIRVRDFDLDAMKVKGKTVRLAKISKSLTSGVETIFYEVESTEEDTGEKRTSRSTKDGDFVSMSFGGLLEIRRESEAKAKQMGDSANLFVLGAVKLNRPLGSEHPREVKKLVLTLPGDLTEALNDEISGQRATFHAGRGVTELVVGHAYRAKASEADIARAKETTVDYPVEVPAVQALAKRAIGDAKTPQAQVAALVAFVDTYVADSYTDNAVAVLDVVKNRKGDCTEHTALFVTLARAVGIPARDVGGLMYMGDEIGAMGGHAWAEVVLDGHWVPVDPTFGEARADAARIGFGEDAKGDAWVAIAGKTLIVEEVELEKDASGK